MTRVPKDFDLSTSRIPGTFYVPPKSRDPREIELRKRLPQGELLLEQQMKGVRVARFTLQALSEPESIGFALPLISVSALNSAWHTYAEPERTIEESVRRRRLKYPLLKDWEDADHLRAGVVHSLTQAETLAADLILLHDARPTQYEKAKRAFSTCVGNAALAGACVVGLGDGPIPGTTKRAQLFAREQALQLAESREAVAAQVGSAPTFAQMVDFDSDLSVYWRRNAPGQAFTAYTEAQANAA